MNEQRQEQASSYVLGALPENERVEFEQRLASDPELQTFVRELQDSIGEAARSLPPQTPSPALKTRVMEKVAASPARPDVRPEQSADSTKVVRFPTWIPWAAAAGFAVFSGWLWTQRSGLREEVAAAEVQQTQLAQAVEATGQESAEWQTLSETAIAEANDLREQVTGAERQQSQLEETILAMQQEASELRERAETAVADADRLQKQAEALEQTVAGIRTELARTREAANLANMQVARLASLGADQPQAMGVSLWNDATQQGVLLVENLPELPAEKTYEFWVIDPSTAAPVSAGIFATDSEGRGRIVFRPKSNIRTAAQFAISVEPPGGSPQAGPTGPVVMAGDTTSL